MDIGGGTTDIAVISLGGIVCASALKLAGDDFDEAIMRYIRKKYNLLIGERSAEEIKIDIGTAYCGVENLTREIKGRNIVSGLPVTVEISSEEIEEALHEITTQIVDEILNVLEQTPPELASDISERGIILTGGGAKLRGLEDLIHIKTGINTLTAEDPLTAVAVGAGHYVEITGCSRIGTRSRE